MNKELPFKIAEDIRSNGGRAFEVGGCIRDEFLKIRRENDDIDIEVYGIYPDKLQSILSKYGNVDLTGKSFAVYRISSLEISLPREDRKISVGHKGFQVKVTPDLPYRAACLRRDFTVNAIMRDIITGEIIDPLNGIRDLKMEVLRACDLKYFADDPLRAYRAMRFSAYLGFGIELNTLKFCRKMNIRSLPPERIFGEYRRMLIECRYPGRGLLSAHACGLLDEENEILQMVTCDQELLWHPEGSVFLHTVISLQTAYHFRDKIEDKEDKLIFMLSVLLHDIGKPQTTKIETEGKKKNRIISPGHQSMGVKIARDVMRRWKVPKKIINRVLSLIGAHHRIFDLWSARNVVTAGAIRRLMRDTELYLLKPLFLSDKYGRGQRIGKSEEIIWLEETIKKMKIDINQLKPLVMGRDLIKIGVKPSPRMGKLLKRIYEAQLDGLFKEKKEGLQLISDWIESEKGDET